MSWCEGGNVPEDWTRLSGSWVADIVEVVLRCGVGEGLAGWK